MNNCINLSGFVNLQNNQIIKKDSVYNTEGLENKTISALEGHYQNDAWNLNFNDGLDTREINVILSELDVNKDGDITDEEIVAFCENVGIAGKENQLAALAKNLINMVTNKDGKDIEIKTTPPAGSNSANNESAAEESTPEKTIISFEIERQKALEEYKKATNNTFLQIRLEGASEYSPLSISALNSLLNGNANADYKLNKDKTEVISGKYAIFDTRTNRYIDPAILKGDNGYNSDGDLQKNIQSGAWIIKTPETKFNPTGSAAGGIKTWNTLGIISDTRFRQAYFTADDAAAKAKYDKAILRIDRTERHQEYLDNIRQAGGDFVAEKVKAIEEYWEATNNRVFQLRLDGADHFSEVNISNLNSLLNGSASSNYKLNFDRTEVISGNYAIFDTRTNKYIDPAILKTDNGSNPDSILQQNLESGAWVIKIPKTAGASGSGKTIQTWSDLAFDSDSRFRQTYFTADDEAAKAKYDKAMSEILKKEAKLG